MSDAAKPEAPPQVRGITEQDYLSWRHHPVSKWFLQYVRDYKADLTAGATEQWLSGDLQLATADEMRGRALSLGEVADMPFAAIATFYQQAEPETEEDQA